MIVTEDSEFDIFVASKIGSLKHIKYHTDSSKNNKKCIENLVDIKTLTKEDAITCMEWADQEQTQIMLGRKNQEIQTYDTQKGLTTSHSADFGPGDIIGLGRYKRTHLAAVASGVVKVWSKKTEMLVETGGKLDRMRVCHDEAVFGTGGEENDLKVWRIGEATSTFSAKNLPHDWLQLRRPVWVSDLAFLPKEGGRIVAVCSRHGYVRLYDTRAQRRPVCNVEFTMAATCMTPSFDPRQVLVGFGRGQLHLVDLRAGRPSKGYKGCVGALTGISLHSASRAIVSTSLDRHLRVHDAGSKALIYKQYLTSKLSCVLVQNNGSTPLKHETEVKVETSDQHDLEIGSADEMDQLFEGMDTVGGNPKKKKHPPENTSAKKTKIMPSIDGSTIELEESRNGEEDEDVAQQKKEEAIAKLLRSTEKQKRKMEKKKRQKKAKSVFHNA